MRPQSSRARRVRTDGGDDPRTHGGDDAVVPAGDLDVDRLLARLDVGDERLAARGHELHRPAEEDRQGDGGEVVLIDVDLDPERAADVGRDHSHAVLGQVEEPGEHVTVAARQQARVVQALERRADVRHGREGSTGGRGSGGVCI
jgi:hypothetical protein